MNKGLRYFLYGFKWLWPLPVCVLLGFLYGMWAFSIPFGLWYFILACAAIGYIKEESQ